MDYLHKIDVDKLLQELNVSADELAAIAGIKHSKNLGKWAQSKPDGSRPNYNALVKLLQSGASVETLFGVEYKRNPKPKADEKIQLTPNDLSWAFGEAMRLLQDKKDKEQK